MKVWGNKISQKYCHLLFACFFLITEYVEIRLKIDKHPIEHRNEWESYFLAVFMIGI